MITIYTGYKLDEFLNCIKKSIETGVIDLTETEINASIDNIEKKENYIDTEQFAKDFWYEFIHNLQQSEFVDSNGRLVVSLSNVSNSYSSESFDVCVQNDE